MKRQIFYAMKHRQRSIEWPNQDCELSWRCRQLL